MDLDDIVSGERTIEILHPGTKEPIGLRVTLVSLDDESLKRLKRRITDLKIKLNQKGKDFQSEELEENTHALIVAALRGWDWYEALFKGEKPEFTPKNIRLVCTEKPWFQAQLTEAIGDTEAFFHPPKLT